MKILLLLNLIVLLVSSCSTFYKPEVWDDMKQKDIHTLRLYTGSMGENFYESNFLAMAQDVCKGKEYKVLEQTRTPTTLHPNLHESGYYNWVVRCG